MVKRNSFLLTAAVAFSSVTGSISWAQNPQPAPQRELVPYQRPTTASRAAEQCVFRGTLVLTHDLDVNCGDKKLVIEPEFRLFRNGHRFHVIANYGVFAEDHLFISYSPDEVPPAPAPPPKQPKSPNSYNPIVPGDRLSPGADGASPNRAGADGLPGYKGVDGSTPQPIQFDLGDYEGQIKIWANSRHAGPGSVGGAGSDGGDGEAAPLPEYDASGCKKVGWGGFPGVGANGGPGGPGGDQVPGGDVILNIASKRYDFAISTEPGLPGKGGKGGPKGELGAPGRGPRASGKIPGGWVCQSREVERAGDKRPEYQVIVREQNEQQRDGQPGPQGKLAEDGLGSVVVNGVEVDPRSFPFTTPLPKVR